MNDKNIIFHVEGGIGKNIMATAVAAAIKKKYPERDIITIGSWPAIWFNNPNVERFYQLGNTPYIFEDYIRDKDTLIMKQEPYHHHGYINKKVHCIQAWCELLGVDYNGEKPEIYLTHSESEQARMQFGSSDKPIFLIQTNGGAMTADRAPMSWVRDAPLPTVLKMIEPFFEQYNPVQIRTEHQPGFENMPWIASPNVRELIALIKWSSKRLFIDSFAQHAAMALGKKSTVLWPMDNVKALGYEHFHDNIVSNVTLKKTHLIDSYLGDLDISGQPHMCPFKDDDIFDIDKVVKSLKRQKDTKFPKSLMNLAPPPQQQQGCGPGQPCPPQGMPPQGMPQQGFGAQPQGIPMPQQQQPVLQPEVLPVT